MSDFWEKLFGKRKPKLPDPFDADVVEAQLDGSAFNPASGRKNKRKYSTDLEPPARVAVPHDDPSQDQHPIPEPPRPPLIDSPDPTVTYKVPQWEEGKDYEQTAGYITAGAYWKDPQPLAEHYSPAISRYRAAKTLEWRGMDENSWFNYSVPVDQPLGGHLQVIVDHSIKITYAYCQKGHIHAYHNGKLHTSTRWYGKSKHFPNGVGIEPFVPSYNNSLGLRDKTIVESPDCD